VTTVRRLAILFLAASVVACSDDVQSGLTLPTTDANVTGTFNLSFANGQPLPYTAQVSQTQITTINSDKIVILANNSWVDTTNYAYVNRIDGSAITKGSATAGTWTITNGQIQFTMTTGGASTFVGAVVNNSLQVDFNKIRYVYSRAE
jgi:hypothetical protein